MSTQRVAAVHPRAGAGLALAIALVTTLAACGSSAPKKTIPRAEFIRRANAICASGNRRQNALPTPKFNLLTATRGQLPVIARDLVYLIKQLQFEHDALAALPEPEGGKVLVTRALAYLQQFIRLLTSEQKAAAAGDVVGFESLYAQETRPGSPVLAANRLATQFGLTACGQG